MKRVLHILLATLTIATATAALAETKESPGTTRRSFVTNCESMGGTIDEGGNSNIIKCKLPSGTVVTCDFATNPPYCGPDRQLPANTLKNLLGGSVQTVNPNTGNKPPKSNVGGSSTVNSGNTTSGGKGEKK